jgi:hypothetical protein
VEEYEEMNDPDGYTALGVGATVYASAAGSIESPLAASKLAGGAQEGDRTSVYYAGPTPAQPAIYDGMEEYEEMNDPDGYTALGVGATVYASAAWSIDPVETRA